MLLSEKYQYRASKYRNDRIEQDHRFIKRRIKPGLGFSCYVTAWQTLQGYEAMNMILKGQVIRSGRYTIEAQNHFISELIDLTA